jgi:hypothetical protein
VSNRTPFTILDAQVFLFLLDAQGNPAANVYLGGCVESATLDQSFTPRRLEYMGLRHAVERHDDEEHTIELKNVWLHDQSEGAARMPRGHERNVRYAMVMIWRDEDAAIWTKRTYSGVTSRGQRIEDSTYQSLRFRAESMAEAEGSLLTSDPTDRPALVGVVRYVSEFDDVDLYSYDSDSRELLPLADLTGRAEIVINDTSMEIVFDGVPALFANAAGTSVVNLVATGSTFLDSLPRLEFFVSGARVASLGADGTLVVVNVEEGEDPDEGDFEFRTTENVWLLSLTAPLCLFPTINEVAEV